jgi:hypothetical protein
LGHENHLVAYASFDFKNVRQVEQSSEENSDIFINLNSNKVYHTWPKVDRCCALPAEKFEIQSFDPIEKISCQISKEEFFQQFVETRSPVILIGCQENWPAKNWTVEGCYF